MAIYHFQAKILSRKTKKTVIASAAYRAAEKLEEEATQKIHDYSRKRGVSHSEILAPDNAPSFVYDRQKLWNAVEASEKRKDAQLAREVIVAIPKELNNGERIELVRSFVQEQFVDRGMVADIAFHKFETNNPHAHVLLTLRHLNENGFGKKNREWNQKHLVNEWREAWANAANQALERSGSNERIDHRSYVDQGIEKIPQKHLGPTVYHMVEKGIKTDRAKEHELIGMANALLEQQPEDNQWLKDKVKYLSGDRINVVFSRNDQRLISPNWPKETVAKAKEFFDQQREDGFDVIFQSQEYTAEEVILYRTNEKAPAQLSLVVDNNQEELVERAKNDVLEAMFDGFNLRDLKRTQQWIDEKVGQGQKLLSDEFGHHFTLEDIEEHLLQKLSTQLPQQFEAEIEKLKNQYGNKFRPDIADWVVAKKLIHEGFDREAIAEAMRLGSPELDQRKEDPEQYIEKTLEKLLEKECELVRGRG